MLRKFAITAGSFFLLVLALAGAAFYLRSQKSPPPPKPSTAEDQQVTLLEGWSIQDIAVYLEEKKGLMAAADFISAENSFDAASYPAVSARPKGSSLEGYIFPDTYRIPKLEGRAATTTKTLSTALLTRALGNFEKKFTDEMRERAKDLGMSVHEVVTLASIVEKETGRNVSTEEQKRNLDVERATVAGIFYNRLNIGMALESDATVNYVTGKKNPSATLEDTQVSSPYNTYRNRGLPPGPIANPSLSSLKAVLYPKQTDYYYFLHKQPSGEVIYSKTFEEHVANKNKYLR